jgi:elongation factor Ts
MDAKRALEATDGDAEAAKQWLREKGLGDAAKRQERESSQGAVSPFVDGQRAGMVKVTSETDFVASSETFTKLVNDLAALVAQNGPEAVAQRDKELEQLRITLKENIQVAAVERIEAAEGDVLDSYLHVQGGRGVNGVLVQLSGGSPELAHDIAVHIAFARPKYLAPEDVPADEVAAERVTLENITRNEGKPEQAIPKIVEGRLQGYFKTVCLLEQPFAKDDKVQIKDLLGGAKVVRWAQVEIG